MAVIDNRLLDSATQQDVTENFNRIIKLVDAVTPVSGLTLTATGATASTTKITVSPAKTTGNGYYTLVGSTQLPLKGAKAADLALLGYTVWNGAAAISATAGQKICVVEFSPTAGAEKGGIVAAVVGG